MRRKAYLVTAIIALVVIMVSFPAEASEKTRLTWTSGGTGGGWFVMAAGMAKIIEEKAPHIQITVIPGGGTTNQPIVGTKKAELGWALPPFLVAARKGTDPYTEKFEDLMVIGGSFSDNYLHVLAAEDTGVTTMRGMMEYSKPIRVGTGKVGVSGEFTFRKMIEDYFRTNYDEIKKKGGKIFQTGYTEIATNLKDRHIDFACLNIAPPAAIVQEAALGRKLRILPWPKDLMSLMQKNYGFGIGIIKKEMYPDTLKEDVPTATMGTVIMVHKSVEPKVVYEITKIVCEIKDRLPSIHKSMEVFDPATAWKDMAGPLHPGAAQYYKEKGYMK
ncbi:MAG: TAXI family TRAP transporter solute-binding subunit [Thermodesulfobacteriota bacterium]|nr:TAXI family TRAP transporter solute-binding subunit [Thermodesulfobacteriota bacterium]